MKRGCTGLLLRLALAVAVAPWAAKAAPAQHEEPWRERLAAELKAAVDAELRAAFQELRARLHAEVERRVQALPGTAHQHVNGRLQELGRRAARLERRLGCDHPEVEAARVKRELLWRAEGPAASWEQALGVVTGPPSPGFLHLHRLQVLGSARVVTVLEGSPGARCGLREGDVIVGLHARPAGTREEGPRHVVEVVRRRTGLRVSLPCRPWGTRGGPENDGKSLQDKMLQQALKEVLPRGGRLPLEGEAEPEPEKGPTKPLPRGAGIRNDDQGEWP